MGYRCRAGRQIGFHVSVEEDVGHLPREKAGDRDGRHLDREVVFPSLLGGCTVLRKDNWTGTR